MKTKFPQKRLVNYAVIAGHIIECFDATLYGFYAVLMAPFFFPYQSQIKMAFGTFAAGFIVRPLGAIFFGFIGDKFGRKKPLVASMALVGVPTLIIGILPTYSQIGFWAPLTLVFCRMAQGFFYGAEYSGVTLHTYENNYNQPDLGRKIGYLVASGIMGAVLATALGALFTLDIMPPQAWRIPFLLGGIAAFVVFFFRKNLSETDVFKETRKNNKIVAFPTAELFKNKKNILVALLISSLNTAPLYLLTVFGNHLFLQLGYTQAESMLFNMATLLFDGILIIFCGYLAERIGFRKPLLWGCLWIIITAIPSFHIATHTSVSTMGVIVFIMLLSMGNTLIMTCTIPYIAALFPTNCRYSGVAISYTLGSALISGNTPSIAHFLTVTTHLKIAPAFWLITIALLTIFGVLWIENASKVPFSSEGSKFFYRGLHKAS